LIYFRRYFGDYFRCGIYIRYDFCEKESLIIHELNHTLQYERLGGIAEFLNQYVKEFIYYGHDKSSIEIEAKTMKTKLKER
jgi:hypothetical protein